MLSIKYYSASWCRPCKITLPLVKAFCAENNIDIELFDVDEDYSYVKQNDVTSVPTIDFYKSGIFVHRHAGTITKSVLHRLVIELGESEDG